MAVSKINNPNGVTNTSVTTGLGTNINVNLYKTGRVVYIDFKGGNYTSAADATVLTIPNGYRPITHVELLNGYNGSDRIWIEPSGEVICKTALNNYPLRGSMSYVCA